MLEEWEQDDNAAVEEVLNRYPEARDFLPLLTASTVSEFEDVAREVATRVRSITAKGTTNQPFPSPRNPERKAEAVTVKEAISNKSWPDYLKAKFESQENDRG